MKLLAQDLFASGKGVDQHVFWTWEWDMTRWYTEILHVRCNRGMRYYTWSWPLWEWALSGQVKPSPQNFSPLYNILWFIKMTVLWCSQEDSLRTFYSLAVHKSRTEVRASFVAMTGSKWKWATVGNWFTVSETSLFTGVSYALYIL